MRDFIAFCHGLLHSFLEGFHMDYFFRVLSVSFGCLFMFVWLGGFRSSSNMVQHVLLKNSSTSTRSLYIRKVKLMLLRHIPHCWSGFNNVASSWMLIWFRLLFSLSFLWRFRLTLWLLRSRSTPFPVWQLHIVQGLPNLAHWLLLMVDLVDDTGVRGCELGWLLIGLNMDNLLELLNLISLLNEPLPHSTIFNFYFRYSLLSPRSGKLNFLMVPIHCTNLRYLRSRKGLTNLCISQ